jgi:hypothetical protein
MFHQAMAGAMLNQGAPLSLIQDVLGHANVNTTKKRTRRIWTSAHCAQGSSSFNPSAIQQVAELEAGQERRHGS